MLCWWSKAQFGLTTSRRLRASTLLLICATVLMLGTESNTANATAAPTVVSLTFDDGWVDQYQGLPALNAHGMNATYFVNSPRIDGDSSYMTWSQVGDLAAAGNEIGGHTAYHVDLPATDPTEAQRQICFDRDNLLARGYQPTDFAYPFGHFSATVKQMVQNCGYNSARTTDTFPSSNPSGQIPPADPYQINVGTDDTTLTAMKAAVTAAENNGGGWVPITFHHICNACNSSSISLPDFVAFLDWLQGQSSTGVVVKTMNQVLGGAVQPAVAGPGLPPAPNGTNILRNASFEQDSNVDSMPDCWVNDDFGNNSFTWTRTTSDAHSGSWAEKLNVTNYQDGDNKLLVTQDLGYCTPSVNEGHRYRITEWYKSDHPAYFTLFTRDSQWQVRFWQSSAAFPASSTWTQASFVTDAIPSGINGLSFGLTLGSNGSLTVDDAAFDDAAASGTADTTAPTVSLTTPAAGSTVSGFVPISANATDNTAVDHVDYLVDGSVATTLTTGPFTYNWNSRTVANGSHTIAVRAVDISGNTKTTASITVFVSNQTTNLLSNVSLEQGSSNPPSCWQLAGYGTNTFAWTWTADAHTGTHAENLNISAYTNGDRKLLTNFTGACSPAVVPGHSYTITAWYKAPSPAKPVIFAFSNSAGGSGAYGYWAQSPAQPSSTGWTQATWSTPSVPAGVTNLSVGLGLNGLPSTGGQVTMDDFGMFDNAPTPDTTPPTSSIACNGGTEGDGCATSYYNGPTEVDLFAQDEPGGSGVARIIYTTDGSTPTTTNGTTYGGPFAVGQTTTVKFRALDKAGNLEPTVHSQLIQIDTIAPTAAIACNGADCGSGVFNTSVSVTMTAGDQGGSGVSEIVYTTDGSTPSLSNGQTYLGAFSVNTTTTIKLAAVDNAGNVGAVNTQVVQIDAVPPTTSISCNNATCSSTPYASAIQIALNATDAGGSGVAQIRYTTDGTTPTATTGNAYLAPFTLAATATVRYRAFDNAGNAETTNVRRIVIDTTAPTVALTAPTAGSTLAGTTTLTATAADDVAVAQVAFLVDGTVVGTDSTAPYSFDWDSTTVSDGAHAFSARATDTAGNQTTTGDTSASVLNAVDHTPPTTTISCDASACSTAPYANPVSVTFDANDNAGGSGVSEIVYTTDGSTPSLTNGNIYVTPFTVAQTATVKYRAFDVAGNAEATKSQLITIGPTSISLVTPVDGSTVHGTVTLSGSVSGTTPDHVDFLVDGTVVGTAPSAPWSFDWDSTTVANGQHSIVARAVDGAGTTLDSSAPATVTVQQVDSTPPTSTITCNGGDCSPWFNANVAVTLAATDAGGSGVASIRYTLDGSTPTATSGTLYRAAFTVTSTVTVNYRAFDNAGNAEAVNSQLIQIDTLAPSSSIRCNSAVCAGSFYNAAVSVSLSASDVGGSGLKEIRYTTDGSSPTTSSGTVYTSAFAVSQTTTVKYRAFDNAGNAEPVNSALIQIDTTPPTTSATCAGSACVGSAWYRSGVSVALTATDSDSGVSQIRYTTNGTVPTKTTGTVYSAPFTLTATTTVNYRAFDNAGNAEANNVMQVQVDGTAPTATLTAPAAGSTVAGQTTLSAAASDNVGVDHVDFLVDGAVVGTATAAPYSVQWSSSNVADGQHSITARAVDSAGNATTSSAVAVIVTNNNLLQNSGLELGSGSTPNCWILAGYGTNTFAWTWTADAHSGTHAENLNITSYTNGDRKLLTAFNGTCSIATQAGRVYTITAWYKSTAKPVVFAFVSTTGATGAYSFLGQSPQQQVASGWTQATWTTPAMPANATTLSVGMGLTGQAGSLTMDDFGAFRTG
jgi:peptidoglycan/xylan/chitin deacetylase (PgdA/CDA1 family)